MHRMIRDGLSKTQIARYLGCSRQCVYNNLKKKEGQEKQRRKSKLDPFKVFIENRLEDYDVPATTLLREIREMGYAGGITILRDFTAPIKAGHVQRVVERFETVPGRQAQVDWGNCGTILHEGRRRRLSLLAVVLGYSRVIWARFVVSERRPVLMELLEECFGELGGVPLEMLFDNMKQVVAEARTADRPARIQTAFGAFADHWSFEAKACPAYWPRAKGKVERAIGYIKTSFLEGRCFTDLEDLNSQLRVWLAQVANVRIHGTTRERPVDRLEADQAAMTQLAGKRAFPAMETMERLADHDARISYSGVFYSVDPSILGARRGVPVEVRIGTDGRLRAYHGERLVADHALAPKGSPPQEDALHVMKRRELRQRPPKARPRGRGPRFEQRLPQRPAWGAYAPEVAVHALAQYEEAPCNPN